MNEFLSDILKNRIFYCSQIWMHPYTSHVFSQPGLDKTFHFYVFRSSTNKLQRQRETQLCSSCLCSTTTTNLQTPFDHCWIPRKVKSASTHPFVASHRDTVPNLEELTPKCPWARPGIPPSSRPWPLTFEVLVEVAKTTDRIIKEKLVPF